jgi:hypothetical protein
MWARCRHEAEVVDIDEVLLKSNGHIKGAYGKSNHCDARIPNKLANKAVPQTTEINLRLIEY